MMLNTENFETISAIFTKNSKCFFMRNFAAQKFFDPVEHTT